MTGTTGTLVAVAVGRIRTVDGPRPGDTTATASWKEPADGPVVVAADHVAGDEQADRVHHGGPDKAVYAYGTGDLAWWEAQPDGLPDRQVFGQNLTVDGLDLRAAVVGERWRIGDPSDDGAVVLEVAQPRIPCAKLGLRAGDRSMPRRFVAAGRPGVYLRVVTPGVVRAGDAVAVRDRPAHGLTVAEVFAIYHHERSRAGRLRDAPALPPGWRDWAADRSP